MDNIAMAHFNANNGIKDNIIELHTCLSKWFDRIVLAAASQITKNITDFSVCG